MNFLLSVSLGTLVALPAFAQEGGAPASPAQGLLVNLPFIVILVALFYFAVISPQKKQQKQHAQFLAELKHGDEVVTTSGLIGTIQGIADRVVTLEVSPDVEVKILRSQIQSKLQPLLDAQKKS